MTHGTWWTKTWMACVIAALPLAAAAQEGVGFGAQGGASANIEAGDVEEAPPASGSAGAYGSAGGAAEEPEPEESSGGSGDVRLGVQARLDAMNVLGLDGPISIFGLGGPIELGIGPTIPIVTPGVRFADDRLFLGLGLGFAGGSNDTGGMSDRSQFAFSLSPLASYDIVSETIAALSLVGWFNIASLGDEEQCAGSMCADNPDSDASGIGLNLGAGVRGKINQALAIGGEFGWGFMSGSVGAEDYFNHGLWGTILFEASVGL